MLPEQPCGKTCDTLKRISHISAGPTDHVYEPRKTSNIHTQAEKTACRKRCVCGACGHGGQRAAVCTRMKDGEVGCSVGGVESTDLGSAIYK